MNAAGNRLYAGIGVVPTPAVVAVDPATGRIVSSTVVKGSIAGLGTPASSPAVAPDPCAYSTNFRHASFSSPPPRQSPAGSSDWRIDVIALPDRCAWTAQSDVPWITLEYTEGGGPDNVGITIAPNATGAVRTGTITIAGHTMTISQAGCTNPIIFFERPIANNSVVPPLRISGWAIDTCAVSGTGLSAGESLMNYGRARPDVGAAFAPQFTDSGFDFLDRTETLPGPRDITVRFRSTLTNRDVTGTVRVNMLPTSAPFGSIDMPLAGAAVSGDMALTGWVMDDVWAIGPVIYRDALPGENSSPGTPGKVVIGAATRVSGARPDVQAAYPTFPENDRAGFGLMVLTNALPSGGNGTFTFHVLVRDTFHQTWLGPRTVTIDNASSPLPFGAIDTPASGETVSGVIAVQGWALTPGSAMIPVDGSTIDVIVDGVVVGHPSYNHARPDVQALFPGYMNSSAPGGFFMLDTRTMTNGVHTIAWVVRDNAGNAKGIGSRYFTVQNP